MFVERKKKNEMENETLLRCLPNDKIKINWNERPIKMELFLSFLTIPIEIRKGHLGESTGWTQRVNKDLPLIIRGGKMRGGEYLDSIQYKEKLQNPYNNYVNPLYLWDIFTDEGKAFFLKYYEDDIAKVIKEKARRVEILQNQVIEAEAQLKSFREQLDALKP